MSDLIVMAIVATLVVLWLGFVAVLAYYSWRHAFLPHRSQYAEPRWLGIAGLLAALLVLLMGLGLLAGAVTFGGGPLPRGCYFADVESSTATTYVMSGKVLIPMQTTSRSNVFYPIPCPAGVGS